MGCCRAVEGTPSYESMETHRLRYREARKLNDTTLRETHLLFSNSKIMKPTFLALCVIAFVISAAPPVKQILAPLPPPKKILSPVPPTTPISLGAQTVTINALTNRHTISPYVYGGSYPQDAATVTDAGISVVRWGGDATSLITGS